MSILQYFVRSYLETDAMVKAKYLAKEYMEQKKDAISKENLKLVIENYDKLNSIGIKYYNLNLLTGNFSKIIMYCIIALIMQNFI